MNLVIALDLETLEQNLSLIKSLNSISDLKGDFGLDFAVPKTPKKSKIWLKVGLRAFVRDGISGIEAIKKVCDLPIFLDLKIYDIPNTMADAINECAKIGIDMLTIHASAGKRAMQEIMARLDKLDSAKPLIMAVSALTSFSEVEFSEVYHTSIAQAVREFGDSCAKSRIDGMVCSVQECALIKQSHPQLLTLTPAIRPQISQNESNKNNPNEDDPNKKDDQRRVASLQEAHSAGADFIVIGRPIYQSHSPQKALQDILLQMQNL